MKTLNIFFSLIFSLCVLSNVVHADTYTVENTNEMGLGSFHQAILDANTHIGYDEIIFNISDTIEYTSMPLDGNNYLPSIEDSVDIIGGESVLLGSGDGRFFEINSYTYIEDLIFNGGFNTLIAGAIRISNTDAFFENCQFSHNEVEGFVIAGNNFSGWGGALSLSNGNLTLSSCYFEANIGFTRGGAVYINTSAILNIIDTEFVENEIDGIANSVYAILKSVVNISSATVNQGMLPLGSDITLSDMSELIFLEGYEIDAGNIIRVDIE